MKPATSTVTFIMRTAICVAVLALVQSVCAQQRDQKLGNDATAPMITSTHDGLAGAPGIADMNASTLMHRIINAPNGTFGYEIFVDGKLFVRQTSLPGRPGLDGCPTSQLAEALATLVVDKMRAGAMPPTVNNEELRTLGL